MNPFINQYDVFCFDLDGTIYLGDEVLPGALELLSLLKAHQKRVLFISNTSTQTREECQSRLRQLGIHCRNDQIVTSAFLASMYLLEECQEATIFLIGEESIQSELERNGLSITSKPTDATHVVVGLDRAFTYQKLNDAVHAVRNGAKLVVTNPDPICPIPGDFFVDTYAIAKAIEEGAEQPIDVMIGKPSLYYGQHILSKTGVQAERCLIVGDRLETDIMLGSMNHMDTCLVLTGAATKDQAEAFPVNPHYVLKDLTAFMKSFQKLEVLE